MLDVATPLQLQSLHPLIMTSYRGEAHAQESVDENLMLGSKGIFY